MRALRLWGHGHLRLPDADEVALLAACESVVARQRDIPKDARQKAIRTPSRDFTGAITYLQRELLAKDDVAKDIITSFEAMLQSHRDPKTNLLRFPWFLERLEWFLGFEQRLRWCVVGLVDIANFKWYKDTVGFRTSSASTKPAAPPSASQPSSIGTIGQRSTALSLNAP
jgi:GGDEF domain-containing protein